ncbi:MAG: methyltransferase family protein [Chloroflexota bacterium]
MSNVIVNLIGFSLTWGMWLILLFKRPALQTNIAIALAGIGGLVPVVWAGRRLLDRQPTPERAVRVTSVVHYLIAALLGAALICATYVGLDSELWVLALPPWLGLSLMGLSGLFLALAVASLLLKGLGLPFALALTRAVVTDWVYAWTRNPMVLAALAFLVGLGLWLRSGLFLAWLLVMVGPVIFVFLKIYEERELEIRFGRSYLDYKSATPMLWPRRPASRNQPGGQAERRE